VYLWLSNENDTPVEVYFDDFKVTHTKSPVVQSDEYYPFGLTFNSYQRENATPNQYLYNGKEIQDELDLNTHDFGFRQYDPAIGRWNVIDPLADNRHWLSPYNYVQNNPINRFDPDGLTDYTLNKKTGEITEVAYDDKEKQKANTEAKTDRIVKTNRKGEIKTNRNGDARTAVGDVEKGILKDGQNFKTDDQIINVGGEGQASLAGVEDFVTKFSEHVGVEIAGAYLSQENSANANISKVYIDEYQGNKTTESSASFTKLFTDPSLKGYNTITDFHTHPSNIGVSRTDVERPSGTTGQGGDLSFRDNNRRYFYNFLILTRTATYPPKVQRIDYTNWKR
jgi:RHS repeat-associated protein